MADILTFPRPAAVHARPCPIVEAATGSLCEAKRLVGDGVSAEAAGRMLEQTDTLACLLIAARHTIALTGDLARDRFLGAALDQWLDVHGGTVA
ncbi:hypothetical protein [Shinella sp. BYT-45]|uniref:hypothetical protein n=1 Tax=Shinella sp. BYT-45 TaxID=3377377 RepID=UPI00398011A6